MEAASYPEEEARVERNRTAHRMGASRGIYEAMTELDGRPDDMMLCCSHGIASAEEGVRLSAGMSLLMAPSAPEQATVRTEDSRRSTSGNWAGMACASRSAFGTTLTMTIPESTRHQGQDNQQPSTPAGEDAPAAAVDPMKSSRPRKRGPRKISRQKLLAGNGEEDSEPRGFKIAGIPRFTGADLEKLARIIEFFKISSDRPKIEIRPQMKKVLPEIYVRVKKPGRKPAQVLEEPAADMKKKRDSFAEIAHGPQYLYFLKNTCNIRKPEALEYLRSSRQLLFDRCKNNKADTPTSCSYQLEEHPERTVITAVDTANIVRTIVLEKIPEIRPIISPSFNMADFEYSVYKNDGNLILLSRALHVNMADTILVYYLNVHLAGRATPALLQAIADRDWSREDDRREFEQNYRKYGRELREYMTRRSERDLKMYYKYYSRKLIAENWTDEEKEVFGRAFSQHKKKWLEISALLPDKTIKDLKTYYHEYYKKHTQEPMEEEEAAAEQPEIQYDSRVVNIMDSEPVRSISSGNISVEGSDDMKGMESKEQRDRDGSL